MTLAREIIDRYRDAGLMITTAESCTGGMIAAALTDIPGSSAVLDRGFVTYSNAAKIQMLGVTKQRLADFGAVSLEVAEAMALGALQNSNAQIAVSVTGIAGPGSSEHKPEGRVCFGLARNNQKTQTWLIDFGALGRHKVRAKSVETVLKLLGQALP
ncbi:MAG: CinA family protein [Pseudomonadota bacterium]